MIRLERRRRRHEAWLAALPCPVPKLEDAASTGERLDRIECHLRGYRTGGAS